ncbi:MAG: LysM peptidoglycan-binding domain-containing protein [Chloroflexi bacterium]|nr:LysM peptidoglycan-binding domain-containing protein [Chloroflexota bacterium]MXX50754.1 LysM peptidoglycan-binding domain-containing protein [Chloroflexota bacterium]MYA93883.1 LysM peptidoglycan-binding domain-containing protein [Chloroflexota bacterium]MYC54118.1 LysM peptidoglycan-binding domain-containing protein [Chloroflexota bacterium]MYD39432.1 LysM peptidoglycan-binding domain-containing protein [Chloroflexota bacterium]
MLPAKMMREGFVRMKPRLLVPLLLCALLLAGCYRQAEETFQQVDSAVVVSDATPTSLQDIIVVSENETGIETRQPYITPETVPGQVEQPTLIPATGAVIIAVTAPALGGTPFPTILPSPTVLVELDPNSPCVHTVQGGDSIFRLAISWETSMDEVAELNDLDDVDVLSLGQLLQIPGCEFAPTPSPTADSSTPAPTMPPTVTLIPQPLLSDEGPPIHVVSSGETLESISLRYRADVNAIIELNKLTNPDQLRVGQELQLPG